MYEGHFEPLWGHFGSTLGSLVHPDGPINRKYTFSHVFCLFKRGTVTRRNPKTERAEVILGLLLAYGGDFRSPCDHLESSWSHFERLKVRFRETLIFPIDSQDFINYGVNSELLLHHFGVSLGSL